MLQLYGLTTATSPHAVGAVLLPGSDLWCFAPLPVIVSTCSQHLAISVGDSPSPQVVIILPSSFSFPPKSFLAFCLQFLGAIEHRRIHALTPINKTPISHEEREEDMIELAEKKTETREIGFRQEP